MCEANSFEPGSIQGSEQEFKPENITSDSGRSDCQMASKRLVKPRSESRQISKTIGEFDPGSG